MPPARIAASLPWLIALLAFGFMVFANAGVHGPIVTPDEGGALANAATIAGDARGTPSSYQFGYSLLIAPAFVLFSDPLSIYGTVKIINALLIVLSFPALLYLARHVAGNAEMPSPGSPLLLATMALAYPSAIVMAGSAFAEPSLDLLTALQAVLLFAAVSRPSLARLVSFGLLVAAAWCVHQRTIPLLIAMPMVLPLLLPRGWRIGGTAAALLSAASVIIVYQFGLAPYWLGQMNPDLLSELAHYPSAAELVGHLSVATLAEGVVRALGQLLYLNLVCLFLPVVASVGVMQAVIRRFRGKRDAAGDALLAVTLFMLLAAIGTALIAGYMFAVIGSTGLHHWFYGRYVEIYAPVLIIAGLPFLTRRRAAVSIAVSACVAILVAATESSTTGAMYTNVLGFWMSRLHRSAEVAGLAGEWFAIAMTAALVGLLIVRFWYGRVVILLAYLAISVLGVMHNEQAAGILVRERYAVREGFGDHLAPGACIVIDTQSVGGQSAGGQSLINYAFFLTGWDVTYPGGSQLPEDCRDGILTHDWESLAEPAGPYRPVAWSSIQQVMALVNTRSPFVRYDVASPACVIPMGCLDWRHDERWNDLHVIHPSARVAADGVHSDGMAGYLLMTSAMQLPAGRYTLRMTASADAAPASIEARLLSVPEAEIVWHETIEVPAGEAGGPANVEAAFDLPATDDPLVLHLLSPEGPDIVLRALHLERREAGRPE